MKKGKWKSRIVLKLIDIQKKEEKLYKANYH